MGCCTLWVSAQQIFLCCFCCHICCHACLGVFWNVFCFFYINKFPSTGFVNLGAGFFLALGSDWIHVFYALYFLQGSMFETQGTWEAPDTKWLAIVGQRGVLQTFVFLLVPIFFCTSVLVCSALAATFCVCKLAPGSLGLTWEGHAADQCTAGFASCAHAL